MLETIVIPAGVFVKAEDNLVKYEVFVPNEKLVVTAEELLKAISETQESNDRTRC
jgi:hypothetical protein